MLVPVLPTNAFAIAAAGIIAKIYRLRGIFGLLRNPGGKLNNDPQARKWIQI
jgi:hypothetical protein